MGPLKFEMNSATASWLKVTASWGERINKKKKRRGLFECKKRGKERKNEKNHLVGSVSGLVENVLVSTVSEQHLGTLRLVL